MASAHSTTSAIRSNDIRRANRAALLMGLLGALLLMAAMPLLFPNDEQPNSNGLLYFGGAILALASAYQMDPARQNRKDAPSDVPRIQSRQAATAHAVDTALATLDVMASGTRYLGAEAEVVGARPLSADERVVPDAFEQLCRTNLGRWFVLSFRIEMIETERFVHGLAVERQVQPITDAAAHQWLAAQQPR